MVAGAASTHTHLNHRDTETQRAHRAHRNLTADHADRRRWIQASLKQVARSRPLSDNGRGPLRRTIASDASVRRDVTAQRPALEARAGLATPHPLVMNGGHDTFQTEEKRGGTDAPLARRPVGSTAVTNARVRSRRASHRGGDRQIADCSAVNLGTATSRRLSASICVICGQIAMDGFVMPSCLGVFVFAT
jgi:hypothetical protein